MVTRFQDYAAAVKPALDDAFDSQLAPLLGKDMRDHPDGLRGLNGGKKIRGLLLCMVAEALGGSLKAALPRAVAVELIQTATLVHDDFVDQHRSRRGRPALWTQAGARRAVLLGDVVFSSAIYLMSELSPLDCGIAARTIADLARGAWQEPLDNEALLEACRTIGYQRIIALKTGMLFAAACELGAVAAGASDAQRQRWRRYGQNIGEAYQLTDDLHEVERNLARGELPIGDLPELAPALLHYVPQSLGELCGTLNGQGNHAAGLLSRLAEAAGRMREDRRRRLQAAFAELDGRQPQGGLLPLARRAPQDLVDMFDAEVIAAKGRETCGVGERVSGGR